METPYDFDDEFYWRPIEDSVDYLVSRNGDVVSFKNGEAIVLKPYIASNGYMQVSLYIDGIRVNRYIHRLVAEAFIEKDDDDVYVVHKEGLSNNVENLRWEKFDCYYASGLRMKHVKSKHVYCYETDSYYTSMLSAAKNLDCDPSAIKKHCDGYLSNVKGYHLCYEEDLDNRLNNKSQWFDNNRINENKFNQILYLKEQGLSNVKIAKELNTSPTTVANWLQRGQTFFQTKHK